uniref:Uncharacterized protein n=1 Tax=Arundo donax TaxID=35708 RepID=A0A0A9DXN1_ARUDO
MTIRNYNPKSEHHNQYYKDFKGSQSYLISGRKRSILSSFLR